MGLSRAAAGSAEQVSKAAVAALAGPGEQKTWWPCNVVASPVVFQEISRPLSAVCAVTAVGVTGPALSRVMGCDGGLARRGPATRMIAYSRVDLAPPEQLPPNRSALENDCCVDDLLEPRVRVAPSEVQAVAASTSSQSLPSISWASSVLLPSFVTPSVPSASEASMPVGQAPPRWPPA